LAELIDYRKFSNEGVWLWTLMQGRKPRKGGVVNSVNAALRTTLIYALPNRVQVTLRPEEWNKGWIISKSFDGGTDSQQNAAGFLLWLESIRQQLDAGKGIYCPYYSPGIICWCAPFWKKALLRILEWAREGKFGDYGEWIDLPPECSCGA
jgi:hypothetical protein